MADELLSRRVEVTFVARPPAPQLPKSDPEHTLGAKSSFVRAAAKCASQSSPKPATRPRSTSFQYALSTWSAHIGYRAGPVLLLSTLIGGAPASTAAEGGGHRDARLARRFRPRPWANLSREASSRPSATRAKPARRPNFSSRPRWRRPRRAAASPPRSRPRYGWPRSTRDRTGP